MTYDVEALRREEFPWSLTGESIYFNNASTGPLPARTVAKLDEWSRLRTIPVRVSQDLQFGTLARCRELIALLTGADTAEIALAVNTGFGINLAAFSLPLKRGDVVLSPTQEFPANVYPWMQLAERRGVEHRMIECDNGVLTAERLAVELNDERIRVVAVSWVQFSSGAAVDLKALGTLCRERDVYFVVDAIQGLGPLRLNLRETQVDVLTCGAQKWLVSPWGAGFVYVRRDLISRLEPHDVSWLAVRNSDDFSRLVDYDHTWRDNARKFEFLTLPFQEFAGMNASLELFHEVGHAEVYARVRANADRIVSWASGRSDVRLVTPSAPHHRLGVISVRPPKAEAASRRLSEAGVVHSLREGAIRLSPHCYNTADEIDRVLALLSG